MRKFSKDSAKIVVTKVKEIFTSNFITGLVIVVPILLTIFILFKTFEILDGWPVYLGIHVPGLGLVFLIALIISAGLFVKNYVGHKLYVLSEKIISQVPIINSVYGTIREVCRTVLDRNKSAFEGVVMLEFPRRDVWAIGFITGTPPAVMNEENGLNWENHNFKLVFIMQAFSPATGSVVMVHERNLVKIDMSVENAMKLVLTGGMVYSAVLNTTKPTE